MCYLAAVLGSSLALAAPDCEAEFRLLVGLRSIIAVSIEMDGFACDEVLRIEEGRFEDEGGRVLKVVCRLPPLAGTAGSGSSRTYRVVAYTEGDFVAHPWAEEARSLARTK